MKIITVIQLLNKIANGEEVPKKIKYKGSIYTYLEQEGNKIYQYEDYNAVLNIQCFEKLNDEVEIIEEEKKIPEKLNKDRYIGTDLSVEDDMFNKINEIIDYLQSKGE